MFHGQKLIKRHFTNPSPQDTFKVREWHQGHAKDYISKGPTLIKVKQHIPDSFIKQRLSQISQISRDTFLPIGFPSSVHSCYFKIHVWQFFESALGSCISVFVAQALLTSVGVSAGHADPAISGSVAVAIQWVLKDSIGEVGKLAFIQQFSDSFDSHPKMWKCVAELCSVLGSLVQLCTLIVPKESFLILASIGMMLRGIHFSIWAATHTTFTRHLASHHGNNVGDIVAKDDAQMSVAHLLGMSVGVSLLALLGPNPLFLFGAVGVMGAGQLLSTYQLVKSAQFPLLNVPRMRLLTRSFVVNGTVPHFEPFTKTESWFGERLPLTLISQLKLPSLRLNASLGHLSKKTLTLLPKESMDIFEAESFVFIMSQEGESFGFLKQSATGIDVLKLYLFSASLDRNVKMTSEYLESTLEGVNLVFTDFLGLLEQKGWNSNAIQWEDYGIRLDDSIIN